MDLAFRMLNVFGEPDKPFSGNHMVLFEDARGLTDEQMNALAQQVNMETSFLIPEDDGALRARFFSPEGERTFAGSASIGTAWVVAGQQPGGHESSDEIKLTVEGMGEIPIRRESNGNWSLRAREAKVQTVSTDPMIVMAMVGLSPDSLGGKPTRIESARAGIVIPLKSVEDVRKAHVDSRMLHGYTMLMNSKPQVYVWAPTDEPDVIEGRMFYGPRGGVLEVPATGAGVSNLGAWYLKQGQTGIRRIVRQGAALGRPSIVELDVTTDGEVRIGGRVTQVGSGTVTV